MNEINISINWESVKEKIFLCVSLMKMVFLVEVINALSKEIVNCVFRI